MNKLKKFSEWHFMDAMLLACVIMLALTFVLHLTRGQWMDAFCCAIWIFIAIVNVHRSIKITSLTVLVIGQDEYISQVHDMFNYARLKAQVDADKEVAEAMEEHFEKKDPPSFEESQGETGTNVAD